MTYLCVNFVSKLIGNINIISQFKMVLSSMKGQYSGMMATNQN
jgi:hypothetical protein